MNSVTRITKCDVCLMAKEVVEDGHGRSRSTRNSEGTWYRLTKSPTADRQDDEKDFCSMECLMQYLYKKKEAPVEND